MSSRWSSFGCFVSIVRFFKVPKSQSFNCICWSHFSSLCWSCNFMQLAASYQQILLSSDQFQFSIGELPFPRIFFCPLECWVFWSTLRHFTLMMQLKIFLSFWVLSWRTCRLWAWVFLVYGWWFWTLYWGGLPWCLRNRNQGHKFSPPHKFRYRHVQGQ